MKILSFHVVLKMVQCSQPFLPYAVRELLREEGWRWVQKSQFAVSHLYVFLFRLSELQTVIPSLTVVYDLA